MKDKVYFLLGGEYNDQNRGSEITSPLDPGVYEGEFQQGLAIARLDAQLTDAESPDDPRQHGSVHRHESRRTQSAA